MKRIFTLSPFLIIVLLVLITVVLAQSTMYELSWWTVDGGGTKSIGDVYEVLGTIGQPDASEFFLADNSQQYKVTGGFWQADLTGNCVELTNVGIGGPGTGITGTSYEFTANIQPPQTSLPVTYLWSPQPNGGQGTSRARYIWNSTGNKVVTVHASNCDGTGNGNASKTISIQQPIDFSIAGMEITQGIQNLANDVPLVQDKITYVRVYPSVTPANISNVRMVLHGTRNGAPLPGSPLRSIEPALTVKASGFNRDNLNDSFYFWIPPSWRSGTVTFRAEINPGTPIPEPNTSNNSLSVTRQFNAKKPLCIVMVRVRTNPITASVNDPYFWDIINWVKAAYPVPDVWIYRGGMIEKTHLRIGIPPWYGGPYTMPDDKDRVLISLWWEDFFTDDPDECGDAYYYGMVHQAHLYQGGSATRPGWQGWFVMNIDPNYLNRHWPWYIPHGGSSLAHELGHSEGRKHVDCGGPKNIDSNYPYNKCDIGPNNPSAYYGFDVLDVAVIPPTAAGDLMSYATATAVGKPRWPSDYTYRALYNKLPNAVTTASTQWAMSTSAILQEILQADEVLAVTGIITPSVGVASFDHAYRLAPDIVGSNNLIKLASTTPITSTSPYTLRLLDTNGEVIRVHTFELPEIEDVSDESSYFSVVMAFDSQAAYLTLYHENTELARRAITREAPTVRVLSPNGGETFTDSMIISWEAHDPDSETLFYTVQYSPDNGNTWLTVVTNHYTPTLVLDDIGFIPGSNTAMVRVIATDGINTAVDVSDQVFQVANKPPDVHITRPVDRAIFTVDTQIILVGNAIDAEDGVLPEQALSWFVDDELLGSGREIALEGLTPGWHVIRLDAIDRDNSVATDTISVFVSSDRSYLPIVTNNAAPDLVVEDVEVTSTGVSVTIANIGSLTAVSPFWVDLYINPDPPPTAVNHIWEDGRSEFGLVWGVTVPIKPGDSLTLTIDDSYYWAILSGFPPSLPSGTPIYVQVDSANTETNYGAVLEVHEIMGDTYNNITGPVLTTLNNIQWESSLFSSNNGLDEIIKNLPQRLGNED